VVNLGTIPFDPAAREMFTAGLLRDYWFNSYSMLFDEGDLRLATTQPKNHFFEWMAAVVIYETTGWLTLVEKYAYRNHSAKLRVFLDVAPPEVPQLIKSHYFGRRHLPDLFVYSPDRSDWYFCEVKGGSDRLRQEQAVLFATLERITGRPVRIVQFLAPSSKAFYGA
jgi:hypothetical protein